MEKIVLKDYKDNDIHVYIYEPGTKIKGVIHIIHGASEHLARYGLFAEFLNKNGYLVIGCDFLGHGLSTDTLEYVHFDDKDGYNLGYESVVLVKEYIEENYKDLDYYLIGHSMGSILGRKLIMDFPDFYKKAIFSGTANPPKILLKIAGLLVGIIRVFKGPKYVSNFIQKLAIDAYPIKMRKDGMIHGIDAEWISRDVEIQQYYHNSKMCGQPFTIQASYDLSKWVLFASDKKNILGGKLDMPILFLSGEYDVVSTYTKDLKKLLKFMDKAGYTNVKSKIYPECRHEILNEVIKDEVYQDMLDYIEE